MTEVQKQSNETLLVDIPGAGALLGLTPWQVRGLVREKELPVVRVGNKFYFRRDSLLRWAKDAERRVGR